MKFTYHYITQLISKMEGKSKRCIEKHDFDSAIQYLSCIAFLKYKFYLGYKDDGIECDIQTMSKYILQSKLDQVQCSNKIAFYDSFCLDNKGLTEQYLDALISNGYEILYIHRRPIDSPQCANIRKMLEEYDKAQLIQVSSSFAGMKRSQWIYENVCNSRASKLFMHLMPDAIEECIAFAALPESITRYQINLTDHAFWVGKSVTDYSIEFRQYGCNLTYNDRGLSKDRILLMPFYPIMKPIPFHGFPPESEGKFIFFTGGSIYKMIDSNLTFFGLCKQILDSCPNAVILVAGGTIDNKTINDAIAKFSLQGRMIPIGHRRDIYEVFKNCDAFINTYPIGGGLMCQFAAQCSKPILNYKNNGDEELVGQKEICRFTSYSAEDLVVEAKKICQDVDYRNNIGDSFRQAVINKDEFSMSLKNTLNTNLSPFAIKLDTQFETKKYDIDNALELANAEWGLYYNLYSRLNTNLMNVDPYVYIKLQIHRIIKKIK